MILAGVLVVVVVVFLCLTSVVPASGSFCLLNRLLTWKEDREASAAEAGGGRQIVPCPLASSLDFLSFCIIQLNRLID